MKIFYRMIVILSLILLCTSTDETKISDSALSAITKLPKPLVAIVFEYLDIPSGFTLMLQQQSWYKDHYSTLFNRQALHYASNYFQFLTRKKVVQGQGQSAIWIFSDPVIHRSDLPTLREYSNFFRKMPNPAILYSGERVLYLANIILDNLPSWDLCTAPEKDRKKNNAIMESVFHHVGRGIIYCDETDNSSADFDIVSNQFFNMVYNPLTTELSQYSVEKANEGKLLMSRFVRIPALLVFTNPEPHPESSMIHQELLYKWRCRHWYDDADKSMYIYWRQFGRISFEDKPVRFPGLLMRFESSILKEIRVDIDHGNNLITSSDFIIQDVGTSTFVGETIYRGNQFTIIHVFYYPSYTQNE